MPPDPQSEHLKNLILDELEVTSHDPEVTLSGWKWPHMTLKWRYLAGSDLTWPRSDAIWLEVTSQGLERPKYSNPANVGLIAHALGSWFVLSATCMTRGAQTSRHTVFLKVG